MVAPIIVKNPLLHLQPLDEDGDDDGALVDVSCDIASVTLDAETPTIDVTTFCGTFSIPDDVTITATLEVTVNVDTDSNWSALVNKTVRAELYDRNDSSRYRTFDTIVPINPSLYGPTKPGEARSFDFEVPVLSAVEWVDVESS